MTFVDKLKDTFTLMGVGLVIGFVIVFAFCEAVVLIKKWRGK